jgi:hypothetical protein
MFFGAVHVHGLPSFACMRGWLGAKYSGQETNYFFSSALWSTLAAPPKVIQPRHARRAVFSHVF